MVVSEAYVCSSQCSATQCSFSQLPSNFCSISVDILYSCASVLLYIQIFGFFFSSHYTTPAQCWAQDLARGLNSSRSSRVHGCGRMGQTSRCFMVCSSPHSHVVCPSSLNPHFCIRGLPRPVPVRRRFRLDQVGHVSLEPGGSDSLGLNESLCGVVWRWLDQRVSLQVRAESTHNNQFLVVKNYPPGQTFEKRRSSNW